ncbi:hypothetical protein FJZ48_02140 [Candidatus Uhrbacteria bacterium]|nr:hypothetical protein [Candidatus Uhrbacteria bacterium]
MPILPIDPQQPERDELIVVKPGHLPDRVGDSRLESPIGRDKMSWPPGHSSKADRACTPGASFAASPGTLNFKPER